MSETVFIWAHKDWPEFILLEGRRGDRQTYAQEHTCYNTWDCELTGRLRFQCSECGAVSLEIAPIFCPNCGRKVVPDEH